MKLVVSTKSTSSYQNRTLNDQINTGYGNTVRAVNDDEVEDYIQRNVTRGFVCHVFDYTETFHGQTSVIREPARAIA